MVRIDDVVTELELDVLDRTVRQILQQLLFDGFGNDVLLGLGAGAGRLRVYADGRRRITFANSDRQG
jgi:hypothetical protein